MYGIPKDLRLERLVGQEINFIGLGRFQIQFHISSLVAIHVEGRWELRDASGALVDSEREHAGSEPPTTSIASLTFRLFDSLSTRLAPSRCSSSLGTLSPCSMIQNSTSRSLSILPVSRVSTFSAGRFLLRKHWCQSRLSVFRLLDRTLSIAASTCFRDFLVSGRPPAPAAVITAASSPSVGEKQALAKYFLRRR